ncbi:CRISPR-associated endonuclease Cas1 1 [Desulfomarina profundi]|uniref:CRISPR-associated endonuclease Cas1 n=1 Tax=Desulfomarina profundi TaxID=2772557 RepID=A0A8D5FS96_9BACT|nr:CRISPR-associated endonuclease Cas1 [Desulfomarina profundi]BCL60476.1 CRISPR-associated endonuclease Cas1 1 [Desulfomarina profundi]
MGEIVVLLDHRDIVVKSEGQVLRIDRPGRKPERVPINMVGRVVVYGSPMVSCDVWRKLADCGVPAILFPGRGKGGPAWLGSGLSTSVMVRLAQHKGAASPTVSTEIARFLIDRKLAVQEKLLELLCRDDQDETLCSLFAEEIVEKAAATGEILRRCRLAVEEAESIESIRGHEGTGATAWFSFLSEILPPKWHFTGRNRRPPRDPVNGLLSLSYTMALSEVRQVVQLRGLDPCVGFMHLPRAGRESLLLDILEPCRPAVDGFVLELIHRDLTPEHFTSSKSNGSRLNKNGRAIYYSRWSERRLNWPAWHLDFEEFLSEPAPADKTDITLRSAIHAIVRDVTGILPQYQTSEGDTWESC